MKDKIDYTKYPFNEVKDEDLLSCLANDCSLDMYVKDTEKVQAAFKRILNLVLTFEQAMDLWQQISIDYCASWLNIDNYNDQELVERYQKLEKKGLAKINSFKPGEVKFFPD